LAKRPRTEVRDFLGQLLGNQVDGGRWARKLSALRHLYRYLLLDKFIAQRSHSEHRFAEAMESFAQVAGHDEIDVMLRNSRPAFQSQRSEAIADR